MKPAMRADVGSSVTLPPVEYELWLEGEGEASWKVQRIRVEEQLSQPYRAVIDLASADENTPTDSLLGVNCTLAFRRKGHERRLCGVIVRVERQGMLVNHVLVRVHVAPALALMAHRVDTRIFQAMTAPDIVKSVLGEGLSGFGREVKLSLTKSYASREYCVQYAESDLAFASRLLEEEGIAYAFDHSGEREVLVLFDDNEAVGPIEAVDGGSSVPIMSGEEGLSPQEGVSEFGWALELTSTRADIREFDWTRPGAPLSSASSDFTQGGQELAVYLHSGTALPSNLKQRAQAHAEARAAQQKCGQGTGMVSGFSAGLLFELTGHGVAELDQKYLITRVEHIGESPDAAIGRREADRTAEVYRNRFVCQPVSQPYRPPLVTPRPRIHGFQTAIVVGPSGEEIHVDASGRIKVQFHWDRQGGSNDKSSCYIRCAQNWSGPGWGFSFVPRIGMEVLVSFLDGDPDRPIVVGSVYNGANPTPYDLPGSKTKSGIRTASSPGGGGNNELTFEDAAGSEQIYFQAQKDLQVEVKNDKTQHVGQNETLAVDGDRSRTIGGNQALTVTKNDDSTIGGNQTITVTGDRTETIGGNQTKTVVGNRGVTISGTHTETVTLAFSLAVGAAANIAVIGAMSEEVGGLKNETVGGMKTEQVVGIKSVVVGASMSETVTGSRTLTTGRSFSSTVKGGYDLNVTKDITVGTKGKMVQTVEKELNISAKSVTITAKEEIRLTVGKASITLKKNGDIVYQGNDVKGTGKGTMKLKARKISHN